MSSDLQGIFWEHGYHTVMFIEKENFKMIKYMNWVLLIQKITRYRWFKIWVLAYLFLTDYLIEMTSEASFANRE